MAVAEDAPCAVHPARGAVGRCVSCGRGACLSCAIPFRGRILCTRCAARELGEPSPPEAPPAHASGSHAVAAVLFAVGLLGTVWPWDRFGALTGFFSAWRPGSSLWPLAASLLLALAVAAATAAAWLPERVTAGAYVVLGLLASLAAAAAVLGSPEFVRHTPAPYVVVAAAAAGAVPGMVRLRRDRRA